MDYCSRLDAGASFECTLDDVPRLYSKCSTPGMNELGDVACRCATSAPAQAAFLGLYCQTSRQIADSAERCTVTWGAVVCQSLNTLLSSLVRLGFALDSHRPSVMGHQLCTLHFLPVPVVRLALPGRTHPASTRQPQGTPYSAANTSESE
eukprot:GHRR01033605.1.p1 GENE.GHRR01033605.1~~GHRR01033605.1.p1  ORF type:complete len:150 (-),score=18.76 GHRR01033605.1:160-609(-)